MMDRTLFVAITMSVFFHLLAGVLIFMPASADTKHMVTVPIDIIRTDSEAASKIVASLESASILAKIGSEGDVPQEIHESFAEKIMSEIDGIEKNNDREKVDFNEASNEKGMGVIPPVELIFPKPKYPTVARKRGIEGSVLLELHIDTNGTVKFADILKSSGYDVLDKAAVSTLNEIVYVPAMSGSVPVSFTIKKLITFRLEDSF